MSASVSRRKFLVYLLSAIIVFSGLSVLAWRYWWMTRRVLIRLRLLKTPANLLRNSQFLLCTNPGFPDYWGSPSPALIRDSKNLLQLLDQGPRHGAKSIRLNNPEPDRVVTLQSYNIACEMKISYAHQPYTFSTYLKSDTDNTPVQLFVNGERSDIAVGMDWNRYSFTMNIQPDSGDIFSQLLVSIVLAKQGSLFVSAPQLEAGTHPTLFVPALIDDHPLPELPWPTRDTFAKIYGASPLNAIVEFSSYSRESVARLLVESALPEGVKIIIDRDSPAGKSERVLEISQVRPAHRQ